MKKHYQDIIGTIPLILSTMGTEELLNIVLLVLGVLSAITSITINIIKVIRSQNLEDMKALNEDLKNQIAMLERLKKGENKNGKTKL